MFVINFYNVTDILKEKISIKNKKSKGSEVDVNHELFCLLNRSSIVESSSLFMRDQLMLMDLVGYPYPQFYVPTNI